MKDTVLSRRKNINLLFTLLAILLLCYTAYQIVQDYLQEQKAVEVDAKIESVETSPLGYSAHVTYKVEGKNYDQYNVDLGIRNKLTIGDYTKIKYNINNPEKLIYNDHLILLSITGTIGFILLIAFLPKRIKIIKTDTNIRKLKTNGLVIQANIQDIIVNQKGKRNKGYFPYRLRANYINPADNQTYLFESTDSYINPNDIISKYQTKTVTVYLDKTNIKNYYVDILSLIPKTAVVDPREYLKKYYEEENAKKAAEDAKVEAELQALVAKEETKSNEKENSHN